MAKHFRIKMLDGCNNSFGLADPTVFGINVQQPQARHRERGYHRTAGRSTIYHLSRDNRCWMSGKVPLSGNATNPVAFVLCTNAGSTRSNLLVCLFLAFILFH